MSTDRDTTRIVRSWLEEGINVLPDRVLDAVLDQVPATPQRRSWWPVRRLNEMNTALKVAIAGFAVLVIAVAGINLVPGRTAIGGPVPTPTPIPTSIPTPTPSPILNFVGSFAPGTTYAIDDACCVGTSRMIFTMPGTGWSASDFVFVGKDPLLHFSPHLVDNVYTGGCHWHDTALVPRVGPTVDDLAIALNAQAGPGAPPPVAVTVGGHPGKKVELQIPNDLDVTTCDSDGDFPIFGRWYTDVPDSTYGAQPYTHGVGQHDTIYIVDVDGTRQVIDAMYLPGASAADRAELDQIVASIRFEPRPTGPTPSP